MMQRIPRRLWAGLLASLVAVLLVSFAGGGEPTVMGAGKAVGKAKFTEALAFDVSAPLRGMSGKAPRGLTIKDGVADIRPERDKVVAKDRGHKGDAALQGPLAMLGPIVPFSFEGISNQDNFNLFGFRVNPPDPVGDVGPNHYVEMVNLAVAVYDKVGNLMMGPVAIGALWEGFAVEDCTDPSGDPIVLYDQLEDRWILSQFTTRGTIDPVPNYNCVAISQTGDPTGAYYRYAFITQPDAVEGYYFPDYPKYGVWTHSYILTSRDFGYTDGYGISVYALEKNKMLAGNPKARALQFFLDSSEVPIYMVGDGLLPPDIDGTRRPQDHWPAPIVGTMDNDHPYGAPSDALNVFELFVKWNATPEASLTIATQLPVAAFDSVFPCAPTSRDCIPQPGIVNPNQFLDILSYRQRPTWRLAYRNFGKYEAMVTNQSVEAQPGIAGVRWYEIRRVESKKEFAYSVFQQGTYSPDTVHRWMGSIAMDWQGNMALGYSVSDATSVYPGIRVTGRLAGDPLGDMTLAESTVIDGTGVQRTTNSRWGDYTSMNVDPVDDCTFWYVNEYYTLAGQLSSAAGWQTRIGSFKMPGCTPKD